MAIMSFQSLEVQPSVVMCVAMFEANPFGNFTLLIKSQKACFWALSIVQGACGTLYDFPSYLKCNFFLMPITSKSSLALILSFDFPTRPRNVARMQSHIFFFNVHYIKIVPQLQTSPIQQIEQSRPYLPALMIIFSPLSLLALWMLSWPNILNSLQLLHQLFQSKLLWFATFFNLTIKTFLSPPWMICWKETSMANITYLIPNSSRARIFITTNTCIITSCDSA